MTRKIVLVTKKTPSLWTQTIPSQSDMFHRGKVIFIHTTKILPSVTVCLINVKRSRRTNCRENGLFLMRNRICLNVVRVLLESSYEKTLFTPIVRFLYARLIPSRIKTIAISKSWSSMISHHLNEGIDRLFCKN